MLDMTACNKDNYSNWVILAMVMYNYPSEGRLVVRINHDTSVNIFFDEEPFNPYQQQFVDVFKFLYNNAIDRLCVEIEEAPKAVHGPARSDRELVELLVALAIQKAKSMNQQRNTPEVVDTFQTELLTLAQSVSEGRASFEEETGTILVGEMMRDKDAYELVEFDPKGRHYIDVFNFMMDRYKAVLLYKLETHDKTKEPIADMVLRLALEYIRIHVK